ncbi:hypothetical protein LOCC1_G006443 [Lachnellula occidentalis]|uniref:Uncharacterized protein n=1 Tax=Lachnellula occidentalis TaxID=215460 RepID=A0A8H8UCG3_9HELO|nr:hypothetical protein LOCC1_G006443 [Lachnellula occidentalis]
MIRNTTRRLIPQTRLLRVANQGRCFTDSKLNIKTQPSNQSQESSTPASQSSAAANSDVNIVGESSTKEKPPKKKTMAELDAELMAKLDGISGEGGGAGVEYEGGKAVGLKRGVKDNMFRVI